MLLDLTTRIDDLSFSGSALAAGGFRPQWAGCLRRWSVFLIATIFWRLRFVAFDLLQTCRRGCPHEAAVELKVRHSSVDTDDRPSLAVADHHAVPGLQVVCH